MLNILFFFICYFLILISIIGYGSLLDSKEKNLQDYKEQSAIGDGFIDWAKIIPEVKKTNCEIYAIEHDDPDDYKKYTIQSLQNLELVN